MKKYKGMTYTVRKDGRLVKKITNNKNVTWLYSYDEKDLYNQYIKIKNNINEGKTQKNNTYTVSQYADIWYDNYIEPTKLDSTTKKMYKSCIRLYIKPEIGNIKLIELTDLDVTKMINAMTKKGITRRREVSLQIVRQILDKAIANNLLYYNPAKTVKVVKHVAEERKPLSINLINLILEMPNELDRSVFMMKFILTTGVRPEELSPIEYNDILDTKKVSINKVVDLDSNDLHIDYYTKNKDKREIPLVDSIFNELQERSKEGDTGLLFPNINGNLKGRGSFRRDLERFLKVLNKYYENKQKEKNKDYILKDEDKFSFTLYQLRHSYACLLHKAEIPLKEAQAFTGHKDLKVLLKIYTHLDEEDIEKAADKLNNFIGQL